MRESVTEDDKERKNSCCHSWTFRIVPYRKMFSLKRRNGFSNTQISLPSLGELGRTNLVEHEIETGNCAPIQQRSRREPFALRPRIVQM